jgi:hypothetical protein
VVQVFGPQELVFQLGFIKKIPQKPNKKLRTSINFFLTSKHLLIIKNKLKEYKNLIDPD